MNRNMYRAARIGVSAAVAALMVACGGGGGNDSATASPIEQLASSRSSSDSSSKSDERKKTSDKNKHEESKKSKDNHDNSNHDAQGGTTPTPTPTPNPTPTPSPTAGNGYTLLAWNDLGMHCVDGKDYSVFSILPPYNNLHAQLINATQGGLVTSGVTLTYEAMADATGSINTTSANKTNFWSWVKALFGTTLGLDSGLKGNAVPTSTPRAMTFNATNKWFEAEGIPITPYDDAMRKNFYPMVKVVAKNASGTVLATARTVLPVSDEMSCKSCHASTTISTDAKPAAGWVNDADPEKDWKKNILRLHDERKLANPAFTAALAQLGYNPAGLQATAAGGQPVLCASCHSSNALPGTGVAGITPLTQALHTLHAKVKDPVTQLTMDSSTNRTACYMCHPGSETQCLRGPMGNALDATGKPAMNCQSCHGSMTAVGSNARIGWLNQPTCQSCHHDGKRELSGVNAAGLPNVWTDQRFASNANAPAAGLNLYRFSSGHGGLQCESCHGATHAEYPSSHVNDNVLSTDVQGHAGTINECTACHTTMPNTISGGPHGMHTTGNSWISTHKDVAKKSTSDCAYCHGADFRGTALSQVKISKTLAVEKGNKTFSAGQNVGCYDCHNGPKGG
ncbi:hypothetical protein [Rhodoferax sp.]|uniref:hypothetical protein n=1 Tax=Rhodoferax sp. TaxID=50421 RepID=UPI002638BA13|nr:hypothetical protein [Rhodoferax sp.]MDD2808012.1 hypothetical protein [Rhodoferax sp.]MDD4942047.1 hypothetical protein [Rhodoferax sp.]MDD5478531.1 hypothetical protein [Rhodoferax sp.]